jgi:hypothetical protein
MQAGTVDDDAALAIARRAVETNDSWRGGVVSYDARREGTGWLVIATRADRSGRPLPQAGGDRQIHIDERGAVTAYIRGR